MHGSTLRSIGALALLGSLLGHTASCVAQQDLGDRPSDEERLYRSGGDISVLKPAPPRVAGAPSPKCGCGPDRSLQGVAPFISAVVQSEGYFCAPPEPDFETSDCEFDACDGACRDLDLDPTNCGACGNVCPAPGMGQAECREGLCTECGSGFTQCPSDASGRSPRCADPSSDLDHCGACSTECESACIEGICQPLSELKLATSVSSTDFAFDDAFVYFTGTTTSPDPTTIFRTPKSGGPAIELVSPAQATRIAVDDSFVYWTDDQTGSINRAPKQGGDATVISQAVRPLGIAVDDTFIYWAERSSNVVPMSGWGTIRRIAKYGGEVQVLSAVADEDAREVVVDSNFAYFTHVDPATNIGSVSRVPKWGGKTLLMGQAGAGDLAINDTHIFGVNRSGGEISLESIEKQSYLPAHAVARLHSTAPYPIAVGAEHVYFDQFRVPKCGGAVARFLPKADRVKISDGHVYWVSDGSLFRRPE